MGRVKRDSEGRQVRRFTIYPGGPRRPTVLVRKQSTLSDLEKASEAAKIRDTMQTLIDASATTYRVKRRDTAIRKWNRFAEIIDIDPKTYGNADRIRSARMPRLITGEAEILSAFAAYCFRGAGKNIKGWIRKDTVIEDIRFVRAHYAEQNARTPGLFPDGRQPEQLNRIIDGMDRLQPRKKQDRLPVMQQHLHKIKKVMDLNDGRHRALWALWLCQWQGLLRSGDLIRPRNESHGTPRRTHTARALFQKCSRTAATRK